MPQPRAPTMTPPPSYHAVPPGHWHNPPPRYSTLSIALSNSNVDQASRSTSPRWPRILAKLLHIIFLAGALPIFVWRFFAYINYAANHQDMVTQVFDMFIVAIVTVCGLAALLWYAIVNAAKEICAISVEEPEGSQPERLLEAAEERRRRYGAA